MEITCTNIISNIMDKCGNALTDKQYRLIQDALEIELVDCIIEKKSYELAECCNNDMYFKEYIASLQLAGKSKNTIKQYYRHVKAMLLDINKDVTDITKMDLKAYYARYKMEHKISNTTLSNMHRYISPFFRFLYMEEYITKNVAEGIEPPKLDKPDIDPFTGEELEILRENIRKSSSNKLRNIALLEFLISTGCRVGEVSNCNIDDVNFINKSVVVTGKGNKTRTVYFTGGALKYLKDYIMSRDDNCEALFYSPQTNSRMTIGSIQRVFRELCGDKIRCNPHRFRHNFAQTCIDRGMSIETVSMLLGHENLDTTMRYYKKNMDKIQSSYNQFIN